jgi:hypothetical protein
MEPTTPRLMRVKSRISAESWLKRIELAGSDEVVVRAILAEAARGGSLNGAIAKLLPEQGGCDPDHATGWTSLRCVAA